MNTATKPTILIVDDTSSNIQVLAESLRTDYRVKVASNGKIALDILAKNTHPDLILLDVMMPDMDGYTTCQHLKNNPQTQNIPIIFVTAKSEYEDEERGLNLGAVDYISKPFHIPIVLARVRNHVNLKLKNDLLETYARLDSLTNIPNRRRFDEDFANEWKRAQRSNSVLSLILIDVDYFKAYNDNYGHGAGDICLYKIASALNTVTKRSGDLIARYGGEEFVTLLPETDLQGAWQVAEQMRNQIHDLQLPHAYSPTSKYVTISAGVASTTPQHIDISTSLLNIADERLYRAKALGRNRICGD
jgi:diguanylate cyclase (GGDEF)-like protein